jgi:8-oxo-dGTP pyrophosphatase MutT (NUDIX family)
VPLPVPLLPASPAERDACIALRRHREEGGALQAGTPLSPLKGKGFMRHLDETGKHSFTAADFRRRALSSALPLSRACSLLSDGPVHCDGMEGALLLGAWPQPRFASVLAGIVDRADGATVLLTQRAHHLHSHPGQVAFPGGKIEADDCDLIETALREAEEEIGLARSFVEPVGLLRPYQTSTGFRMAPVLAVVKPGFTLKLDAEEVAGVFEAPLAFLMDEKNHQKQKIHWRGEMRQFYTMPFEGWNIWGATAAILRDLYEKLYCDAPPGE